MKIDTGRTAHVDSYILLVDLKLKSLNLVQLELPSIQPASTHPCTGDDLEGGRRPLSNIRLVHCNEVGDRTIFTSPRSKATFVQTV
eukprot:SAG11_NODE_6732_length_1258_cov_0.930112_2_plen_86_part_00